MMKTEPQLHIKASKPAVEMTLMKVNILQPTAEERLGLKSAATSRNDDTPLLFSLQ